MFTLLTAATAAVVSTTPPVGGLLLAAIGLKALSDAAEISRDAREHDSDRRSPHSLPVSPPQSFPSASAEATDKEVPYVHLQGRPPVEIRPHHRGRTQAAQ